MDEEDRDVEEDYGMNSQTSEKESPDEERDYGYQQPQEQQQQPQQQYGGGYQGPQQYQQRSMTEVWSSDSMIMWGIFLGVILLIIGVLLNGIMFFVDNGDTVETLMGLALIFLQIGGVMFVLFLSMTAIFKEKLDNYVKFGLLIVVALILYAILQFMSNWGYVISRLGT